MVDFNREIKIIKIKYMEKKSEMKISLNGMNSRLENIEGSNYKFNSENLYLNTQKKIFLKN